MDVDDGQWTVDDDGGSYITLMRLILKYLTITTTILIVIFQIQIPQTVVLPA